MPFQKKILNTLDYLFRKVLLIDLGLAGVAALSFVITGRFSFTALSERIFWISVAIFLIAGMLAFAQLMPGRLLMFPYNIRKPEAAKNFVKTTTEYRESGEKRLDVGIQLWLVGLGLFGLSALVQTFLGT